MSVPKDKPPAPEAIEYQSDAVEIRQARLPFLARYGVFSIFFLLAAAIVWACIGQVDVVVTASAKIVTDTPPIVLKPLERTVIKEINVRVGDMVEKDQILMTFDTTQTEAEVERLNSELSTLAAQFNRMQAEFDGAAYAPGAGANNDELWQLAIYKQRQEFFEQRLAYYAENLEMTKASQETTRSYIVKQRERLKAYLEIEERFVALAEKKIISAVELAERQINRMQMEAELDQRENSLIELEHQYRSTAAERDAYVEQWRNDISTELVRLRRELISTQASYDKMKLITDAVVLRSPARAVVHEIAAFSIGSAVREAEALITLIPVSHVELEAEVRPEDIGKVQVGDEARIKLTAFPFQKHGTLDGIVRNISEDTLQRSTGQGDVAYYRVRIFVSGTLRQVPASWRMIPGMEGQAEIKIGRRRIIEYLIYPLIKSLDEAAREP